MKIRKPVVLLACAAAAAAFFLCNWNVQSESQNAQMKLGGSFIGHGQAGLWSALQMPLDPACKSVALRVKAIAMPGFTPLLTYLDADPLGEMVGEEVMVSRDTASYYTIGYATKGTEIKAILQMTGTFQFVGPDDAIVTFTIKVFAPSADADGDGFPDANATPMMPPIQGTDTAKRAAM